ncbi:MAG TPA: family 16 glycoside hydrolase [Pirellulales bacterium]|nr:family 16 glycoside hydrolase [Pirellulales bacterium]
MNHLKTWAVAGLLLSTTASVVAAENNSVYETPQAAQADPDFVLQGEYVGQNVGVQVVALGKGDFRVVTYRGGLPGAGFDGKEKQITESDREDVVELVTTLKKVDRASPTLGAKPPADAVVLFDGSQQSLEKHWRTGARRTEDGLLMRGCTTIETFRDFTLHLEFRLPYMPQARDQGRGNSGVYYQGRYETQVLDSFGLEGKNNECGGIYSVRAPDVNMCLPPLTWQTYDVEFTAARWDADGKKTADARLTVRLNGVLIHQDAAVPGPTTAAPVAESLEPGPLYLQDHGSPVRYRNIWLAPRDAEREAQRPIVPGFERFFAVTGADTAQGGRLLLGELGCTACHAADAALQAHLLRKQAPVLDAVGARLQPEWMLGFIADPHGTKPGTTMPNVFVGMAPEQRETAARAIVNFLYTTGRLRQQPSNRQFAKHGEQLFKQLGCVACHAPRDENTVASSPSAPLPEFCEKYTLPSLAEFLKNPHQVRPSGRMPSFNLNHEEARDLACYLIGDVELRPRQPNLRYAAYEGAWGSLPDFDKLTPYKTGDAAGLDLTVAERTDNFGVRFDGFLKIERAGDYTFHLGSDDGSILYLDGNKVIDNGDIHPHQVRSAAVELQAGMHAIRVEYMQGGGEWTLELDYEAAGVPRQPADLAMSLTDRGQDRGQDSGVGDQGREKFVFDPAQVAEGRELFATLGCANCHELKQGDKQIESKLVAKPLGECNPAKGCLRRVGTAHPEARAAERSPLLNNALTRRGGEEATGRGSEGPMPEAVLSRSERATIRAAAPAFGLTGPQREALAAALAVKSPAGPPNAEERISQAMIAFNCYACHARGGVGGPTPDRNPLFLTLIPEMGDEGRVPPPLDGVGDKLQEGWLRHVLAEGAKDRPYMLTRMPRFATPDVTGLAEAFISLDQRTTAEIPKLGEPPSRVKATGRLLVGDKALACIKCHTFGRHRATGIQALSLLTMTRRIREDWFHRYLPNPSAYRPGTRMPSGFINGRSTITSVYDGDPGRQIAAIWTYLTDGDKAGIPDGLIADLIELKPETRPIIYRNFIDGLTPRGIAVGYPEKAHLAWDANQLCLALAWHGRFIDASRHWTGRGDGFQRPLGDHVVRVEQTAPLAVLDSPDAAWPTQPPKERGYHFRGYRLDAEGRPTFSYQTPRFTVDDKPVPVAGEEPYFDRHISLHFEQPLTGLYLLLGAASEIKPLADGWHQVGDVYRIRLRGGEPILRTSGGRQELLAPIVPHDGMAELIEEIVW